MIGPKSTSPMPGPRRLTSWAWKWPAGAAYCANQLGDGRARLAALRLDIHVQLQMRMIDPPDHLHRLGTRVEEVGLAGASGSRQRSTPAAPIAGMTRSKTSTA